MAEFTEIMTREEKANQEERILQGMTDAKSSVYASFIPDTIEGKKAMYNMLSEEGISMMDSNGKAINIKDVAIMPVTVLDDKGTEGVVPRCCIATVEGEVYTATSWGCYNSLSKIQSIFGTLHFDEGLEATIKVVKTKKGKTINLVLN